MQNNVAIVTTPTKSDNGANKLLLQVPTTGGIDEAQSDLRKNSNTSVATTNMMTCDAGISEHDKSFLSPSAADQKSTIADLQSSCGASLSASGFKHTIRERRESKRLASVVGAGAANSGGKK